MMLVIQTQDYENYAWVDGELQTGANAYWKAKGGSEYKIANVPAGVDIEELVDTVRSEIERSDDYFISTIIGYCFQENDYLSWFEKSQLDYEGVIEHPEPRIEYNDLIAQHAE